MFDGDIRKVCWQVNYPRPPHPSTNLPFTSSHEYPKD